MRVMRSVIINAPIDTVWEEVRRFDAVFNWNPTVVAARMESGTPTEIGSIRVLDIEDGSIFRETLLAHSDLEHFYTYNILNSPLRCSDYISTHRFIEITEGNKTLGIWQGEFDCDLADTAELESVVGDMIYRDGQLALSKYLQEKNNG